MPKTILVVDDDPTSNMLVGFLLKSNGYTVNVASDGEEGLAKAEQGNPDLIVLDVMMPKMDGYTFLRKLKSKSKAPPVIMLTSKEKMEDTFKMEGAAHYFIKPLNSEQFLEKVKQLAPPLD